MAFVGRVNSHGNFVDSEVFNRRPARIHKMPVQAMDEESQKSARRTECSRTYIKCYDSDGKLVSSPGRVRFVDDSASSCELNSTDDAEMSTLRYCSHRSWETETATLTPHNSTENSSLSEGSGSCGERVAREEPISYEQPMERGSTTSMCSWEEEEEGILSTEESLPNDEPVNSGCVPQLELGSDTASLDYEQHVQLKQLKFLPHSDEAYNNWLSGKKRQSLYKQQVAQRERLQKQQEIARRQEISQQRVREWNERKARECANKGKTNPTPNKPKPQPRPDVVRGRLQSWELKKIQQAEQQRLQQQREALRKEQEQRQRKQQAALAWQQWFKNAAQRPKPVPLNQGLNTLRGTVSNIYVNPNPWVHVNEQTSN